MEVTEILSKYWVAADTGAVAKIDEGTDHVETTKPKPPKSRPKRSNTGVVSQADSAVRASSDAEKVANDIKSHADFAILKAKVLDVQGDWINKCRMVAMVAGVPITSGDVHRVLTTLRIRSVLSTLSRTLSGNSTEFLTKGSNPVKYEMTSAAEDNFRRWLAAGE